ncbi:MAG: c-type cytochrome [Proteobacteria bacterium]|nr:c-type cytochrome [Pseudomonadota bacterium]
MRTGEKWIWGLIAAIALWAVGKTLWQLGTQQEPDPGIPFYSTATPEITRAGSDLYRQLNCKNCHTLWTMRNMLESVPAPALDGIGSLRDETWFYNYFSAPDPQSILPSRLKQQYRMPSYAHLPEHERRVLAAYMAGLKVQDWYLEETRKAEYEKLTGKDYRPQAAR